MDIPQSSTRLLVFVAVQRGPVERARAAGTLWPDVSDQRAAGNLRSALWRLSRADVPLLTADKHVLSLAPELLVDVYLVSDWACRVTSGDACGDDLAYVPTTGALNLLPGCYEDWALVERERLRQRMLHALEALSRRLVDEGRSAEAVDAATAAVAADPLRQSAQRALIEAHLSERNWSEARRQLDSYRVILRHELGIEPDPELVDLVAVPKERRVTAPRHQPVISPTYVRARRREPYEHRDVV